MENNEMKDIVRRLERMEAANAIQNVMGRYVNLHCASRQAETCELFCNHTQGTWCCFSGDVFNGYEGSVHCNHGTVILTCFASADGFMTALSSTRIGTCSKWRPDDSLKAL